MANEPAPARSCRVDALDTPDRVLVQAASAARAHAHAPFSRYPVGAAARVADGTIYPGCNIEISSYGLTLCAERVAVFAARAAGAREIRAVAVVGPGHRGGPTSPCGACRQVLYDLAPDARLLLATTEGAVEIWSVAALLPRPFGPDHLERAP